SKNSSTRSRSADFYTRLFSTTKDTLLQDSDVTWLSGSSNGTLYRLSEKAISQRLTALRLKLKKTLAESSSLGKRKRRGKSGSTPSWSRRTVRLRLVPNPPQDGPSRTPPSSLESRKEGRRGSPPRQVRRSRR